MVLRAHPLGDVAAFGEDAGNPAMSIADRLKDEIDEALFRPPCRIPLQIDGQTAADERLLRFVDLVEQLVEALSSDLRQGLEERLADDLAPADELVLGLVDELEHMVGTAVDDHEARGLWKSSRRRSFSAASRRSAMTRSVVSTTIASTPPGLPVSSMTGL